ncbi:MAG: SprT-like domain-containing protein [Gemmatimonadota bacterium]
MPQTGFSQLGFDFDDAGAPEDSTVGASPAPSQSSATDASGKVAPRPDISWVGGDLTQTPPARGRAAVRARTAVLFSRLQGLGLRGIETLVLMRTRTVMVSLIGRTLRVHEGYADASDDVLQAIVTFATSRTRAARTAAKTAILSHDVERVPAVRRAERARPGDAALVAQLAAAHRELNAKWFDGALQPVPLRLSGRMASRLGHYDPGSRLTPPEIALSRSHVVRDGWREALHTLLHEMVHQWQHETGETIDHGAQFRRKCREVGITPAARRTVQPILTRPERERRRG